MVDWNKINFDEEITVEGDNTYWKPETVGETLKCVFNGLTGEKDNYNRNVYQVIDDKDQERLIVGSVVLDNLLSQADGGDILQLTYEGEKQAKNGTYKMYSVKRAGNINNPEDMEGL